jgi:hypothetical protein
MAAIPPKEAQRVTLRCLRMMILIAVVLRVSVSEAAVVLAWDPSPDPQIVGYNVYRSESLGAFSVPPLNGSTLVSEVTFTDSTGELNRPYYYVVTAVNAVGQESAPSAHVHAASGLTAFSNVQPVETTQSTPPSNAISASATTLLASVGAAVTTSVSADGLRSFEVNGTSYPWGLGSDIPVPGDFDGDGQTDISVFTPDAGYWHIRKSSSGFSSYFSREFGVSTDTPVPDDYDADGRTDIAVFRPSTGVLHILTSSSDFASYISY